MELSFILYNYITGDEMRRRYYTPREQKCFPIYAETIGCCHLQEPRSRPQGLNVYQLSIVTDGQGILMLGDARYELSKGDLFFLPIGAPHEYYGIDEAFSTSWISFLGDGVEPLLSYYKISGAGAYLGRSYGNFEKSISELYEVFHTDIGLPLLMAKVYEAVVCFFEEAFKGDPSPVERIKLYLERHFAEPLTLEDIFAGSRYSRSKLCKDFKERYGETVFEMLTRIRLNNAERQLQSDPMLKVKDVAGSCGFNDCSYFCRMYKKQFGKSPKALGGKKSAVS